MAGFSGDEHLDSITGNPSVTCLRMTLHHGFC